MRVIAGRWKGHRLVAPRGRDTRPTADRVREAVYSAVTSRLGDLEGRAVADLYAGSGALGFEALSRGAGSCVFVELDRDAVSVIKQNAASLGLDSAAVDVVKAPVAAFVSRAPEQAGVSLLLADPPYRIDAAEFRQVLEGLVLRGFLAIGALVVYEHAVGTDALWPEGFVGEPTRRYGNTAVSFATYEG